MTSAYAFPSCFNTGNLTKENTKVFVTSPLTSQPASDCCVCAQVDTASPWQQLGNSATFANSLLTILGMLFLCAFARQTIAKSCCRDNAEEWQRNFCAQDVKGKILTVLDILDSKERDVRAAKDRLKCAEKLVRRMKLSTNQVHAAILCQMVKLREALDWVESAPQADRYEDAAGGAAESTSDDSALDTLAKISVLESQIHRLTAHSNEQSSRSM